jgi:hypothetical protein
MTVPGGYYEQSYPPSLWGGVPLSAARDRSAAEQSVAGDVGAPTPATEPEVTVGASLPTVTSGVQLGVTAGSPGTYSPPVKASERPRNVTELRARAVPAYSRDPWEPGQYVQVGESGKRAHWDGNQWRAGESPGYAPGGQPATFPGTADDPADQRR